MLSLSDLDYLSGSREIRTFQKKLNRWYESGHRALPWRVSKVPYRVWVSEVMLQQTQVKTVVPYYQRFVRRFPDVFKLAAADLNEVLKSWEGLGYYARARNLHRAARLIVAHHGGMLPDDGRRLRSLPGVGDYIAAAVLSIAFGRPHAVVDGNVKRVLARLFAVDQPVNAAGSNRGFAARANRLLADEDAGTHNQAMMELGALVCTASAPHCSECPVADFCLAFQTETVAQYPKTLKKPGIPEQHIATGIVCKGRRLLITRRRPEGLLGGLWEFPGGKILENEAPEAGCIREIKEETNLEVEVMESLARVRHAYTHFKIRMEVFKCRYKGGRIRLKGPVDFRWIRLREIGDFPLPGANHKFLNTLHNKLKEYY